MVSTNDATGWGPSAQTHELVRVHFTVKPWQSKMANILDAHRSHGGSKARVEGGGVALRLNRKGIRNFFVQKSKKS